jgi:sulfite exporter TauE/SafE
VIFAAAAALGVMSSAHCVAMCGPLVLLVSGPGEGTRARQLARAALYHSGRTTSYAILGAAAGGAGHLATSMGLGQTLAVTFGVVLIVAALARTARVRRHVASAPAFLAWACTRSALPTGCCRAAWSTPPWRWR